MAKYRLVMLSGKWVAKLVTVSLAMARGLRLGVRDRTLPGIAGSNPAEYG